MEIGFGHRIPFRDYIIGPTTVLIWGLTGNIDRSSDVNPLSGLGSRPLLLSCGQHALGVWIPCVVPEVPRPSKEGANGCVVITRNAPCQQ